MDETNLNRICKSALYINKRNAMYRQYLDAEVLPDEGEEGGGEVDPPLPVQGHVHADELLVGQPGGTFSTYTNYLTSKINT